MVKFIQIAQKNLKTVFRDKKALFMMLLIPILYYCIMGFVFSGIDNNGSTQIYYLGWIDQDSTHSNDPYKNLDTIFNISDELVIFNILKFDSKDIAMKRLINKELDAVIIFPEGFELYLNGTKADFDKNISIYYRESTDGITRAIISSTLQSVIEKVANDDPSRIYIILEEKSFSDTTINEITQGTPGYLIYGILSSFANAVILITTERKEGLLKRLETSEVRSQDILLGHLASNTVQVFIQFSIALPILSLFGFQPNIYNLFSAISGVILTVLLLSFLQNALALVASTILKTPEAAGGGVWIFLIPLMVFSGAFFPLELIAPGIIPYVGWIPTRIVVVLFQDLLINSLPLWNTSILLNFLWILLESIAIFLLGIKLYKNFVRNE